MEVSCAMTNRTAFAGRVGQSKKGALEKSGQGLK